VCENNAFNKYTPTQAYNIITNPDLTEITALMEETTIMKAPVIITDAPVVNKTNTASGGGGGGITAYRSNSTNQIPTKPCAIPVPGGKTTPVPDSAACRGICLSPPGTTDVGTFLNKRNSNTTEHHSGSIRKESLINRLFKRKIAHLGSNVVNKSPSHVSPVYEKGSSWAYISPKPSAFVQKQVKRGTATTGTNTPTENDDIAGATANPESQSSGLSWPIQLSKTPATGTGDVQTQISNYEFLLKAQKDNIRTLELALQECKLDSLQLVPLRYTITSLKTQMETLTTLNSTLRSDSTSAEFKLLCSKDKYSKLEERHCAAVDRAVAAEAAVAKLTTANRGK